MRVDAKPLHGLNSRYGLLRTVLDKYLLPDFGIDPSHVIVAVYPPALENEHGVFCPQGNAGLTIATFPPLPYANACKGSVLPTTGVLAQYPATDQVERDVEHARVKLNGSLAAFALRPQTDFDIVNAYTSDFASRGVCATTDSQSRPAAGEACFTATDFAKLHCALSAESMHLPRAESGGCADGVTGLLPFSPIQFEPYRSRTRLFRTLNDVFLAINQRQSQYLDQGSVRVARPVWTRDRRRLSPNCRETLDHRQRDDLGTLSAPRLRTLTRTCHRRVKGTSYRAGNY